MPTLQHIAPIIPVTDVKAAAAFFCDTLGFQVHAMAADAHHAIVERGAARFTFLHAPPGTDMTDEARENAAYIWVDDIDALWAEMRPALDPLPEGRVRAPFDQDYGMREFHVTYESLLIFFGSPVKG